jgi:putative long chain acyl-CoA synthase
MLMARVSPTQPLSITPLRSLFHRDDAWVATGDLFRRDADGDYWRVDGVADVIHTARGHVFTAPIRDALGDVPAVDLALAYGVQVQANGPALAVAAVTERRGRSLTSRELTQGLAVLPPDGRPGVVHVVARIPVTTWFRPMTQELRAAGLPEPGAGVQAWYLDASGEAYRPLTPAARQRLTRSTEGGAKPKRAASGPSKA